MGAPKGNQYRTGHTKYTHELIAQAREYLENFKTEHNHEIPSVVGLARVTGIPRNTFYLWINSAKDKAKDADADAELSESDERLFEITYILEAINETQELTLMNNGLNGSFNPAITKLALGKHGYHDKQDNSIQGGFSVTIGDKDAGTL